MHPVMIRSSKIVATINEAATLIPMIVRLETASKQNIESYRIHYGIVFDIETWKLISV